ncbi:hypothetical protein BDN67DRAFT_1065550 [Paxillus ammoniavirescens]|nr:hypothetical protein BDN67DRAFT_1065550 [Paxillus ammoniavirescens]
MESRPLNCSKCLFSTVTLACHRADPAIRGSIRLQFKNDVTRKIHSSCQRRPRESVIIAQLCGFHVPILGKNLGLSWPSAGDNKLIALLSNPGLVAATAALYYFGRWLGWRRYHCLPELTPQ